MFLTLSVRVPVDLEWLRREEVQGRPGLELLRELAVQISDRLHDELRHVDGIEGRHAAIDHDLEDALDPERSWRRHLERARRRPV
jgi:hypothetical protein